MFFKKESKLLFNLLKFDLNQIKNDLKNLSTKVSANLFSKPYRTRT